MMLDDSISSKMKRRLVKKKKKLSPNLAEVHLHFSDHNESSFRHDGLVSRLKKALEVLNFSSVVKKSHSNCTEHPAGSC